MTQSVPSLDVTPAESGVLEWTCDPWRENARVAGLSASAAFASCVLLATLREPFLVFAGLCLFVFAAFSPAFTPVRCRADRAGVARRGWLGWERRGWAEIRRMELLPAAVLCSPFAARHPLDAARALALPMPRAERERCFAALQSLRSAHGG